MAKRFNRIGCVLFEGQQPASLEDLPFDVNDLGSVLENAVLSFYTDVNLTVVDSDDHKMVQRYNVKSVSVDQIAHYQQVSSGEVLALNYNYPSIKMYGEVNDVRPIGDFVSRQHISRPIVHGGTSFWAWYVNGYYWTHFELPKEMEVNEITMYRDRYYGAAALTIQYLDSSTGEWKDITGQGQGDSDLSINWSSVYENDYIKFEYFGNYRYKATFKNPVTTTKLRVRIAGDTSNPANKSVNKYMGSFSVGTTTDLSDLNQDITPTWGIAFGWASDTLDEGWQDKNSHFLFSVGSDTNAELKLSQATFDPKTIEISTIVDIPLEIKTDDLV